MNRLIALLLFAIFVLPIGTHAKMNLFTRSFGKKIVSDASLLSYRDLSGKTVVVKGNLVETRLY